MFSNFGIIALVDGVDTSDWIFLVDHLAGFFVILIISVDDKLRCTLLFFQIFRM